MAYTTKSGDTWDVIAKQVYGSEYHADILMAANPQQIDTFLFEAGVVLATPVLEEERDGLLPPWKYEASYGWHQHRVWLGGRGGHYRQSKRYPGGKDLPCESGRQPVAHCCAAAWQRCPLQGDQGPERVEK